jgi:hypothetical protein
VSVAALLALLRRFLGALIPAALSAWWAERQREGAVADKGAAEQRAADQSAEDEITAEAKGQSDEIDQLPDVDAARRFDRFRVQPKSGPPGDRR